MPTAVSTFMESFDLNIEDHLSALKFDLVARADDDDDDDYDDDDDGWSDDRKSGKDKKSGDNPPRGRRSLCPCDYNSIPAYFWINKSAVCNALTYNNTDIFEVRELNSYDQPYQTALIFAIWATFSWDSYIYPIGHCSGVRMGDNGESNVITNGYYNDPAVARACAEEIHSFAINELGLECEIPDFLPNY